MKSQVMAAASRAGVGPRARTRMMVHWRSDWLYKVLQARSAAWSHTDCFSHSPLGVVRKLSLR